MVRGREFKVIIRESGQIFYNDELIAILGEWNKYEDLAPEELYEKENR